jgi:CHAT domain-containing protein
MKKPPYLLLFLTCCFLQCKKTAPSRNTTFDSWIWQNIVKVKPNHFQQNDSILKYTLQEAKRQLNPLDTAIASILHKIAVNYKNYGHINETFPYCDAALKIRVEALPPNHRDIARSYTLLGMSHVVKGEYIKAVSVLQKSLKMCLEAPQKDSTFLGYIYTDLARCYGENGDYYLALETNEATMPYLKPSEDNFAKCLMERGVIYDLLKQPQDAGKNYHLALNWFIAHKENWDIANCYHNLAMLEQTPTNALPLFQKALQLYQSEKDSLQVANTLIEMAKQYALLRQYEQANSLANQALQIRNNCHRNSLKHYDITESYAVLGDIAAAQNNFQTALNHYQQAIDAFDERTFTPVQQIEPLFGKAKMLLQLGRKKEALTVFNTLDIVIQKVTHQFKDDKSKFNLLESHFPIYEKAIQTAFELFESNHDSTLLQQAFQFSSHSKAVALRQAVNDEKAKGFANIPKDILEKERSLKQDVVFQQKQCFDNPTEMNYKELYFVREKLNLFVADLEKIYPKYYDLKYQSAQVIDLQRLQKSLPNEMMSLEFFAGDSMIYTFALTRNHLKIYQLPLTKDFDTTIYQVRKSLVEANQDLKTTYLKGAHRLYELLLEKPLNELNANHQITRLRMIPDGKLGYIPFDALLTAPATDWLDKYDKKVPFLLRSYSTSYAYYSDSLLNQKAIKVKGDFHGFGIDYKDSLTNKSLKNKYGYLEEAPREVDTIKHFIGGKTWKNEDATKNCFLQNATKSGILHLSMHSTTNDKNPLESQLIFSKNDSTDDNLLIGNELFAQQFTCGLAVLSACHTGDGLMQRGEGIMSLARAFAYSGCPSLVMSLWSIPDRSTSNIMLHFYQNLKHNLPKDVALQQSKLQYLDNQPFEPSQKIPNFWAATVMIGDVNALHFERWYEPYWVILLIISVLCFRTRILRIFTNRVSRVRENS